MDKKKEKAVRKSVGQEGAFVNLLNQEMKELQDGVDKQKQIEEMFDILERNITDASIRDCNDCAEHLYNAGYRKIPEGSVVLTREEYDLLNIAKKTWASDGEEVQASTLIDTLKRVRKAERKETAEKFAEMLKDLVADRNCNEDYEWEDVQVDGQIFIECVDEICKEITEGKV